MESVYKDYTLTLPDSGPTSRKGYPCTLASSFENWPFSCEAKQRTALPYANRRKQNYLKFLSLQYPTATFFAFGPSVPYLKLFGTFAPAFSCYRRCGNAPVQRQRAPSISSNIFQFGIKNKLRLFYSALTFDYICILKQAERPPRKKRA